MLLWHLNVFTMAKNTRIDINEQLNSLCLKKCNKEKRKEVTEEDLCTETISEMDKLPVRCVGAWAVQKIHHLVQYFAIFSLGMKNKWDGKINYIEICSGPGRCINRETGFEFNGTSLCIVQNEACKHLNKALFFDYNETVVSTLNSRINANKTPNALALVGDYNNPNKICDDIIRETKGIGLYLIFIDPTDCSIPFSLLQVLKERLKHVDFIVNFAIKTDFNRNIKNAIQSPNTHQNVINKYKSFLGSDDFFHNPLIETASSKDLRSLFREAYVNSLKKIGYQFFDFKPIENYYDLVFASSNERGIEFWEKANKIQFDGQRQLF